MPELENFRGTKKNGNKVKIVEVDSPEESVMEVINSIPESSGNIGIIARTNSQIDTISSLLSDSAILKASFSDMPENGVTMALIISSGRSYRIPFKNAVISFFAWFIVCTFESLE